MKRVLTNGEVLSTKFLIFESKYYIFDPVDETYFVGYDSETNDCWTKSIEYAKEYYNELTAKSVLDFYLGYKHNLDANEEFQIIQIQKGFEPCVIYSTAKDKKLKI